MRLAPWIARGAAERIHAQALRVLAETGLRVEHPLLRARLEAQGGRAEAASESVRFPAARVEAILAAAPREPFHEGQARVDAHVWVCDAAYLDPFTGLESPFDEAKLAFYAGLGRSLPQVGAIDLLGVPFQTDGLPSRLTPLAERLYAWKWGYGPAGSVHDAALCAPIIELTRLRASAAGKPFSEYFRAEGYLVSPLRLAKSECEQLLEFERLGQLMKIGHLPVQGATAPATLAGAAVLSLAEQIFLYILKLAFDPKARFSLMGMVSPADMGSGNCLFGRPEQQRMNALMADLARFYGCPAWGHCGLTDAARPSAEAGAQKAMGALLTALSCGHGSLNAGLLKIDRLCSPVQMLLDCDCAAALQALLSDFKDEDVESAAEEIAGAGIGGGYLDRELTLERCRSEFFTGRTWSRGEGGMDSERAKILLERFAEGWAAQPMISAAEEAEMRRIIALA